jgi:uncharacterized protein YqeY
MTIRERLANDLKTAMRAKDNARLAALRLMNAAIKDREIAARGEGNDATLSDTDLVAVLTRMVKQRRDSARAYEEAARLDLAEKELAEIAVIEEFLPRQMSEAEIKTAVDAAIAATGASTVRDIGAVMGWLKERHTGQMDLGQAGAMVKARLA